mmetsp:Transcript_39436/g.51994  ORF Transcript_39436/g.51994 Transcript_39436/m.51994 type:complete len:216 (-) Transcript_39436:1172-1819(-)
MAIIVFFERFVSFRIFSLAGCLGGLSAPAWPGSLLGADFLTGVICIPESALLESPGRCTQPMGEMCKCPSLPGNPGGCCKWLNSSSVGSNVASSLSFTTLPINSMISSTLMGPPNRPMANPCIGFAPFIPGSCIPLLLLGLRGIDPGGGSGEGEGMGKLLVFCREALLPCAVASLLDWWWTMYHLPLRFWRMFNATIFRCWGGVESPIVGSLTSS